MISYLIFRFLLFHILVLHIYFRLYIFFRCKSPEENVKSKTRVELKYMK